ncbi:MAG TPA: hypothetical protein VGI98_00760 [Candidatus Limnocylindrales bacterium]|jgi:hypothetical protein
MTAARPHERDRRPTARHPGFGVRLATAFALAASLLATGLAPGRGGPDDLGPALVAAATPGLTLVTDAVYTVNPTAGTVAVRVAITATNHLGDTATKRYYFRTAYLAVLPSTTNYRLTTTGGAPRVAVSRRTTTYTLLRLDFGSNLVSGATRKLTLTFDLKDPGGAPDRPIRISTSLVSFYAWAYATPSTPGSTVSVSFPAGYNVTVGRGPMTGPAVGAGGSQTWTSGALAAPLSFVADLTADHPAADVDMPLSVTVGGAPASLILRSWPDDAAWRTRVGDLVSQGLPVLSRDIGLAWPITDSPLVVQEALVRSTGGYAGLFDPAQHRVEIAYAAQPGVILHESAHAWFNGALVADRWAAEAFASYYAEVAAGELKVAITSPALDDAARAAAIPLNAWGAVGSEPAATEAYGYAASLDLARAIAQRAGAAGLRTVWQDAAAGIGAYQPAGASTPETGSAPPDWRGLLDLLEDTTGRTYVDLWRTWVVRPQDLPALDERATARAAYATAVSDAGDWGLPRSIRDALRSWQFDVAEQQLTAAESVLGQRTGLQRAATTAAVQLPPTLEADFEAGRLTDATAEAGAELATMGTIYEAARAQPATVSVLGSVGLIGITPASDLAAARAAFATGDLTAAQAAAVRARDGWAGAEGVGRGRIISAIGLLAALVLLVGLVIGYRRRRSAAKADGLHSAP